MNEKKFSGPAESKVKSNFAGEKFVSTVPDKP